MTEQTPTPQPEPAPETPAEGQAPAKKDEKKGFWSTLPGILAGIAALFTALGGLLTALITLGVITPRPTPPPPIPPSPTPVRELRVIETQPRDGDANVDPALTEVVIVFSGPVRTDSWSFIEIEGSPFPELAGDPTFRNAQTCVLPVRLERGASYGIGINGPRHRGFVSAGDDGLAAEPYVLHFTTAP